MKAFLAYGYHGIIPHARGRVTALLKSISIGKQFMFENLFGSGKNKPAKEPATEKQKKFAETLGVKNADSLSKEEASEQIDKKLDAKARSRKGWISNLEKRVESLEDRVGKKPAKKATTKKKK